jgi:hypothetical protein
MIFIVTLRLNVQRGGELLGNRIHCTATASSHTLADLRWLSGNLVAEMG